MPEPAATQGPQTGPHHPGHLLGLVRSRVLASADQLMDPPPWTALGAPELDAQGALPVLGHPGSALGLSPLSPPCAGSGRVACRSARRTGAREVLPGQGSHLHSPGAALEGPGVGARAGGPGTLGSPGGSHSGPKQRPATSVFLTTSGPRAPAGPAGRRKPVGGGPP